MREAVKNEILVSIHDGNRFYQSGESLLYDPSPESDSDEGLRLFNPVIRHTFWHLDDGLPIEGVNVDYVSDIHQDLPQDVVCHF